MVTNRDPSELTESELVDELQSLERVFENERPSPEVDPEVRREDLLDEVYERLEELARLRDESA